MERRIQIWGQLIGLAMFVFVGMYFACAHKPTPLQAYAVALEEFTGWTQTYNAMYKQMPLATQEEWKQKIDPIVLQADAALDAWKEAMGTDNEEAKYQAFKRLKDQTFATLLTYEIIKVEE